MDITVRIEIPGLPEALNALAGAIGRQPEAVAAPKTGALPAAPAVNPTTPAQPAPTTGTAAPTPVQPAAATTVAPIAPSGPAESYTLEVLSRAGAALIDEGKMPPLLKLLDKYGVQAVTQLPREAYSAFAAELKALGAQL